MLQIGSSFGTSAARKPSPKINTLGTDAGLIVPAHVSGCPSTNSAFGIGGALDHGAAISMLAVALTPDHEAVMGTSLPAASAAPILSRPVGSTLAAGDQTTSCRLVMSPAVSSVNSARTVKRLGVSSALAGLRRRTVSWSGVSQIRLTAGCRWTRTGTRPMLAAGMPAPLLVTNASTMKFFGDSGSGLAAGKEITPVFRLTRTPKPSYSSPTSAARNIGLNSTVMSPVEYAARNLASSLPSGRTSTTSRRSVTSPPDVTPQIKWMSRPPSSP